MRRTNAAESGSDRVALAQDAGMGRISLFGVLAGTLVAYGAFVVLLAVVAAVADVLDVGGRIAALNWEELGTTGGLVVAGVLLVSYLFGGYVAGRMARRAGALNGFLVFVLGVLVVVGVSVLINVATDGDDILRNFRTAGIPTSGEEWGNAGTVAGIASLVAIVVGPILGGILGERWHAKLARRALDPSVGRDARQRRMAEKRQADVQDRPMEARPWTPAPPPRAPEYRQPDDDAGDREEVPIASSPVASSPVASSPGTPAPAATPEDPPRARGTAWGASRPWADAGPDAELSEPDEGGPRPTRRTRVVRPER